MKSKFHNLLIGPLKTRKSWFFGVYYSSFISLTSKFGWLEVLNFLILEVSGSPDYESVWPDSWPQNKWRSPWPLFHGPVILCYILMTIWCMNIILGDYGSVWPDVWLQNKGMSLWPIFHSPLILLYISKTIWWMSFIFLDNETVWHKLWPENKCRSAWPIFMV